MKSFRFITLSVLLWSAASVALAAPPGKRTFVKPVGTIDAAVPTAENAAATCTLCQSAGAPATAAEVKRWRADVASHQCPACTAKKTMTHRHKGTSRVVYAHTCSTCGDGVATCCAGAAHGGASRAM